MVVLFATDRGLSQTTMAVIGHGFLSGPHRCTVDGRNPAPPKKPWNDESPVNANKQWFLMVSKWCRISSIHSMVHSAFSFVPRTQFWCPSGRQCEPRLGMTLPVWESVP